MGGPGLRQGGRRGCGGGERGGQGSLRHLRSAAQGGREAAAQHRAGQRHETAGTAPTTTRPGAAWSRRRVDKTCLNVYKDFGEALMDPAKCCAPANSGTPGCKMLADLKSFVDDNPELILDMLQFVLGLCGLIPGVGEVCDARTRRSRSTAATGSAACSRWRGDPGIGYLRPAPRA